MRTIEYSSAFRRDYKRIKATPRYRDLDALLSAVLELLVDSTIRAYRTATAITP